jgi:hypothetical protein
MSLIESSLSRRGTPKQEVAVDRRWEKTLCSQLETGAQVDLSMDDHEPKPHYTLLHANIDRTHWKHSASGFTD